MARTVPALARAIAAARVRRRELECHLNARRAWCRARTLAELGELTAAWLEDKVAFHPGYTGRPDPETAEFVPALAAANRAGFVTFCSQPGVVGIRDGVAWRQRAGVEGLARPAVAIRVATAATAAGLTVVVHPGARRWRSNSSGTVAVTGVGDLTVTDFGAHLSRRALRRIYAGCHPQVIAAVVDAWQITLVDFAWGHNGRLWPLLDDALDAATVGRGRRR